jgi:uncharacterized damage-inducible protein DinB
MDKETFLEAMRAARAEWEAALARVPAERLLEPGVAGGWSVKDVIAHVAWHEREMLGVTRQRALVGSPWWDDDTATRNEKIYAQHRDQPLSDVLAEAAAAYRELEAALEALEEADFEDAGRFAGMPAEWTPWELFADNTTTHYRDHARDVQAWLAGG